MRLREVLAESADDREVFEEDPRVFLSSCGAALLPRASRTEMEQLGEVLESTPQGMRYVVLDSVVDDSVPRAAADPNNPDPQFPWVIAVAAAVVGVAANVVANVNAVVNVNARGAGADAQVLADRSSQYSVVADRSFFSSAAARDLGEAGLSENRVRALVRSATRQQEISPAADGSVVLTYPYHGRTLELVGRVEGSVLHVTDGSLTAQNTHAVARV